ncbi:MAG TPA: amino acid racemase [Longimicrobiales bacterium]
MITPIVGIVGGLGPESTIDYYRRILELWQEQHPDSAPEILIDSLDVTRGIEMVRHDRAGLVDYLANSVERLARAGADFAVFAANTPHIVFDEVAARSPVPLLSIVEVCAEEAQRHDFERVAVLGTGFTMEAGFYPAVFGRRGIQVVVPNAAERAWLHERYLGELLKGIFHPEARDGVHEMTDRLRAQAGVQATVLAGTELPLLLKSETLAGLPILDSTELHVRAIVRRLTSLQDAATSIA